MSGHAKHELEPVIAVHEAAHVVVRYWVGKESRNVFAVKLVRLDPQPKSTFLLYKGRYDRKPTPWAVRRNRVDVMYFQAGPLAAQRKKSKFDGGRKDRNAAEVLALQLVGDDKSAVAYLSDLETQTRVLLNQPHIWSAVKELASELQSRRSLAWHEIRSVIHPLLFP